MGLASFGQLQRFPETPVQVYRNINTAQELEESSMHPFHLQKRADSQDSIKEVGHLRTSTSRGALPQYSVCERDPEFTASRAVDTEIP